MEDGFSSYSSLYDTSSLLQFCNDDSASAASSMDVADRIASLEQRVQMQEDEIQLLKSALADVVRRLNASEEQSAMSNRRGPTKARPMMAALPLRPTVNNGTVLPKKSGGTMTSPSGSRKEAAAPANKRLIDVTSTSSTVRRTNSNETMGTLTRKDSGESKSNRTRAGSTGSNSSGKRVSESKLKEPVFNAGMRRVTHCKVSVQIYLSQPSKRPRNAGAHKCNIVATCDPSSALGSTSVSEKSVKSPGVRKTPTFVLPLRKSVSQSSASPYGPLDMPCYRSPLKSPSQYFQICY